MPYSVITHSGKAHIDEILAIAAIIVHQGEKPVEVIRMGSEEAASLVAAGDVPEDSWVVDCGLAFDPERKLFDHHQDRELPSAALMVFRHLFPDLADTVLAAYFELVSKVDTRGARSLDDADDIGESRDYWSFPQQVLVKVFESDPMAVADIVARGLDNKIRFEGEKRAAAEWVSVPGRLVDVDIEGTTALEYTQQPPIDVVDGLKGIDSAIIEEHHASVVYGFDKQDASIRTLYRTDIGHDRLDLSRSRPSDALFNHQGGFLMRFRPASSEEWKVLVSQALIR